MKQTIRTAVVGAVIAATTVLAAPGAASANDLPSAPCMPGKICLYDGHNNTGDLLQLDPVEISHIWEWNDRASSVWNRSGVQACIHTDADFYGHWFSIPSGAKQELLFLYDNAVSSIEIGGCSGM